MSVKDQDGASLTRLVAVMQRLLAPDGCPSLEKYALEEACEVIDAIEALGDDAKHVQGPAKSLAASDRPVAELREELGDLLLQVVFQAELARSRGWFGPDDVVSAIVEKLERRHPHVFGDAKVSGTEEVLQNWERLKAAEKKDRGTLSGMPKSLPALLYAFRLGEKAGNVGFDWRDAEGPRAKIDEEIREMDAAAAAGDAHRDALEHEIGDLLFSVVNFARKKGIDPEAALKKANKRFERRFSVVEKGVKESGREWKDHSLDELDAHWNAAKKTEG